MKSTSYCVNKFNIVGQNEQLTCRMELHEYHTFADELTNSGDFVYKGSCFVVQIGAREELLDRRHRSHIGINGCIRRDSHVLARDGKRNPFSRGTLPHLPAAVPGSICS